MVGVIQGPHCKVAATVIKAGGSCLCPAGWFSVFKVPEDSADHRCLFHAWLWGRGIMCLLWLGSANKIIQNYSGKPGSSRIPVPGIKGAEITESKQKLRAQAELRTNLGTAMRCTTGLWRGNRWSLDPPLQSSTSYFWAWKGLGWESYLQGFRGAIRKLVSEPQGGAASLRC